MIPTRAWWKEAVVYQIYPISFADSNGDGLGDLNGIYSKLDYLKDVGVDVVWLSPIYPSPLADMGYDISDYRDIDKRYGTLDDWDKLVKGLHDREMKLVMDLVVNHSSDEHEWFIESRSSKINPKRDWYVWRPPKYDEEGNRHPPNNWKSIFQGPAWDYDEATGEYYLHLYVSKQPDLNWENEDVRHAAWDVMRFWLERGCDGFRMDVINKISKVKGLPDAPITIPDEEYQPAGMYYLNGPRVHEFIKELNSNVLSHYDVITVGETPSTYLADEVAKYVLPQNKELNMVFQFELMDIDAFVDPRSGDHIPMIPCDWTLSDLKNIVTKWQVFKREEGFWNAVFIENHDQARSISRFADDSDEWRARSAKLLAMLQITQGGTLYVYQGEEIGMRNFPVDWGLEEYKDVATQNYWNNDTVDMSDVIDGLQRKARDHGRTPMQWNDTTHAGFTTGTPWMRVNDDYKACNAESQTRDETSVLSFWKRAIQVRKARDVLTKIYGDFVELDHLNKAVFAYTRSLGNSSALVLLNFSKSEVEYRVEGIMTDGFKCELSNYASEDSTEYLGSVILKGFEGRVYFRDM
ncbi:hypothetical protein PC9H_004225 [Pleurotus ostreatus]|uniref:Glycosyl hydrolase family 13 catalytic domain-containing protein n=1 Tax=Pleurotus ostreatus TaxID=5322 RepID=A0A8H7A3X6_PLEOS|nr:uncharacterized protein PC9H_004225 [Pleurotus ostreatus]KAF7437386.1 hypothetical protein PC9H_004225 [Pleurotus ostreatus]